MKNYLLSGLILLFVVGCGKQEQRYTQQSPEIETVKQLIKNYNEQAYDMSLYADTSKTYYNSKDKALSSEEVLAYHQANDANYSSRKFLEEDQEYEMVVTDDGQTWVNCWLDWQGSLKGSDKTFDIPIHLTYQFKDGKVVREVGMWDPTEVVMARQAMEMAEKMSVEEKAMAATAKTIVKAWNTNDAALMASAMTPDFVRLESGVPAVNSAEGYGTDVMAANYTAFPDFHVTVDHTVYNMNQAIIHWTVTGTNKGEFNGNPPTGKKITTHGMSVWTFNPEGKAVSEDAYYDRLGMVSQMGYSLSAPE